MSQSDPLSSPHPRLVAVLLVAGTVAGLTGIDLILPAVPTLPIVLGGSVAEAQLVLAAYVGGVAAGLLVFGSLVSRFDRRLLLLAALVCFGLLSLAARMVPDMTSLVFLRAAQGFAGSAPAVFAPAVMRQLFDERGAVRAIGILGGIESLVPAFAPVAGTWLLSIADWRAGFTATGVAALLVALSVALFYRYIPGTAAGRADSEPATGMTYFTLIRRPMFLRYALSQATVLGGLLVFVFGAPAVFVTSMNGTLDDFIRMQVMGVACFIIASSQADRIVHRLGAEVTMRVGTLLAAAGSWVILGYGLAGGTSTLIVAFAFLAVNLGLGVRGPVGFLYAMKSAGGADDRASSLTILAIMGVASAGTAILAPFIGDGLVPLAFGAAVIQSVGLALFLAIRPFHGAA